MGLEVGLVLLSFLGFLWFRDRKLLRAAIFEANFRASTLEERFGPIIDADKELTRVLHERSLVEEGIRICVEDAARQAAVDLDRQRGEYERTRAALQQDIQNLVTLRRSEDSANKARREKELERVLQKRVLAEEGIRERVDEAARQAAVVRERLIGEYERARAGLQADIQTLISARANEESTNRDRREKWERDYSAALSALDLLQKEVEALGEEAEIQSFGLYKPRYEFASVDGYSARLTIVRDQQKAMIKAKRAAVCHTEWTVNQNRAEGRRMTEREIKLMLRAFNGECDAIVATVTWKNIFALKGRLNKTFETINALGESSKARVTPDYLGLKHEELELAYEYSERRQRERDEEREERERRRDEERAAREIEKEHDDAERDEDHYRNALERARAEVEIANAKERASLDAKIAKLESLLGKAAERKQRAIAQAEMTRAGHVYVLSNVGTFGENVFKIGLTRRLDPMDRVLELGSASVPFHFDVHAFIWSEDAPALESALHKELNPHRLNLVNMRKEFFRVPRERIIQLVEQYHGGIEWKESEQVAYRKSLAVRAEREAAALGKVIQVPAPSASRMAEFQELKERLGTS